VSGDPGRPRLGPRLALAALLLAGAARAAAPQTAAPGPGPAEAPLAGEVAGGQVFERAVAGGLVFRLVPIAGGWSVWLGPPDHPPGEPDWSAVATPPFRGVNPRELEGWHFAPPPAGEAGAPHVPGAVRDFAFVTSAEDYRAAGDAVRRLLWPGLARDREAALQAFEAVAARAAHGRLLVREAEVGPAGAGGRAGLRRLRFEVELFRAAPR
jgi:hypothetical protein